MNNRYNRRILGWLSCLVLLYVSVTMVRAGGCDTDSTCGPEPPNMGQQCEGGTMFTPCNCHDQFCTTCHVSDVSCFPAGTKVLMEHGQEQNIEQIHVGRR